MKCKCYDVFDQEFFTLTALINRYAQCAEIYHPLTGEIYGGLQEAGKGESGWEWESCARQSCSASGYLRMLLCGVVGMQLAAKGIDFAPYLPAEIDWLEISDLPYRRARLNIRSERGRGNAAIASVAGVAKIHRLQDVLLYIGENGFRHHVAIAPGRVVAPVGEALGKYLGFKVALPQTMVK